MTGTELLFDNSLLGVASSVLVAQTPSTSRYISVEAARDCNLEIASFFVNLAVAQRSFDSVDVAVFADVWDLY